MLRRAFNVALLAVVCFLFFHAYTNLGINYHFHKHYPGECRHVEGLDFGSEDMEVTQDGLAFITSGLNYNPMSPNYQAFLEEKNIKGRIFLFDFKQPKLGSRPLRIRPSKTFDQDTFQPHGLGMIEDNVKGGHLLYVVNHVRGAADRVEKFRFIPGTLDLEHVRSFNDSIFNILNDVALVSEDAFYATNYLYFQHNLASTLEHLLPLPLAGVLYVDRNVVTEVVTGVRITNGVTLSRDKKFLYVAFPVDHMMRVYERQNDNGLKLVQNVPEVYTSIDNFMLSQAGDALLAGCHPIPYKIMGHLMDPRNRSPSSVLRLPLNNGRVVVEDIAELFYDHGEFISASSSAYIHSNQLLIGSVIDKLVVCDLYGKMPIKK